MPLHLLGKKSWNVYNTENIARVRQDEATAKAQEEQEERKWRENDAERRLQLLRGEVPSTVTDVQPYDAPKRRNRTEERKHRKLLGEDDTDRDIRLARELVADSPDQAFAKPENRRSDAEKEIRSDKQVEPQGIRFKDAVGTRPGSDKPWYTASAVKDPDLQESLSLDVWGNEDPRRREREQHRMSTSDPLLAMKRGVKKLRDNEKERKAWLREREKDMYEVEQLASKNNKRKRRREDDNDSLEGFNIDHDQSKEVIGEAQTRSQHKHKHSHNSSRRRDRSTSIQREKYHSHHRRSRPG